MAGSLALPWGQLPQESCPAVTQAHHEGSFLEHICSGQRIEVSFPAIDSTISFRAQTGAHQLLPTQVQWQLSHGEEEIETKV